MELVQTASYLPTVLLAWGLLALAHWRMFAKAGERGWKALIPLYSDYVLFKLVWSARSFWIYVISSAAFGIGFALSGQMVFDTEGTLYLVEASSMFWAVIAYAGSIVWLIYTVLLAVRTSLAYGKSAVFGFGVLVAPHIFKLIIAFGKSAYRGTTA